MSNPCEVDAVPYIKSFMQEQVDGRTKLYTYVIKQ